MLTAHEDEEQHSQSTQTRNQDFLRFRDFEIGRSCHLSSRTPMLNTSHRSLMVLGEAEDLLPSIWKTPVRSGRSSKLCKTL